MNFLTWTAAVSFMIVAEREAPREFPAFPLDKNPLHLNQR